ncbi:MAG: hypothetical protein HY911_08065 [Desulfobacterales bacterium]|nr:hypothetical protein [Desulfobacterales bacterium]
MERSVLTLILVLLLGLGAPGTTWAAETPKAEDEEDADLGDLLHESAPPAPTPSPVAEAKPALPLGYEGEVRGYLWSPSDYDEQWHTTDRLDLTAWAEIGALDIAGRLKLDYQDIEQHNQADADLRELYAQYPVWSAAGSRMDLALGKKMIYWGKGDEVRPIDRVSPQDLSAFLFYDINERKTGRVGTFADVQMTRRTRFEGFWSPYFEASDTPGLGDFFEPTLLRRLADNGIAVGDEQTPDEWSADAGYGGRLIFSVLKADLALYAFQGYDPNPTYVVDQLGTFNGLPIVPLSVAATHPRMTLYGADIERTVGPFVLRAEAAYQPDGALFSLDWSRDPTLLLEAPDGVAEKPQLQYVFGIDKNDFLTRNLFLNLQFLGSHIYDYDPRLTAAEDQRGMTATLRYAFLDSKMTAWYRYIILFEGSDQRHHAEIAYNLLTWAQVGLGAVVFEGTDDTAYFGQYDDRDFVYAKLKLVF